jgi:hypothetical protein
VEVGFDHGMLGQMCSVNTFWEKSYVNVDAYAPPSPLLKICTYLDIKHLDSAWLADGASFGGG